MPKHEKLITKWEHCLITKAVELGYSVVIDQMNLNPKTVVKLKSLLLSIGVSDVSIQDFTDVPLEVCIERDKLRENSIGEKVLRDTYKKYLDKTEHVSYTESTTLKKAIVCDLDGTLALFDGNPYERDFMADRLNPVVADMIHRFRQTHEIILLSGRNGKFEKETREWLKKHEVLYDYLWMRAEGDTRKDSVVKRELFEKACRGQYYVDFVLDDRLQVCRLWYSMGLTVLRVGDPDADF